MDIYDVSMSWLLYRVLQWTLEYMYLFKLWFSLDRCPGVGLLDQMVILFLIFWGLSILLSTVGAPMYWKASRVKIPLVRARKRRHPKSLTRSGLDANSKRIFIPSALGPTVVHHTGVEDCGPECGIGTAFMGFTTKPALLQTNHFKISQTSQFKTSRARALWTNWF